MLIEKNKIMDEVFECYYGSDNELFNKLINDFCIRDDKSLKKYFLNISNKLEMVPNVIDYLNTYIDRYYDKEYVNSKTLEYEKLVLGKLDELKSKLYDFKILVDGTYYSKVEDSLSELLNSNSIEDIMLYPSIKLPTLPRGSEDEVKTLKDEISDIIKSIINYVDIYGSKEDIINNIYKTKDYVSIMIDIIKKYLLKVSEYKQDNEMYEFTDIALLAIKVLKENKDICDEVKYSLTSEYLKMDSQIDIINKSLPKSYGNYKELIYSGEKNINGKNFVVYDGRYTDISGIMFTSTNRFKYNVNVKVLFYQLSTGGYLTIKVEGNGNEISDELLSEITNFEIKNNNEVR